MPLACKWQKFHKVKLQLGWNNDERGCMATNRRRSHPKSFKIDYLGFRLARNLERNKTMIKLEKFNNTDFERLITWADNEEILVQFSGPIFKFPLTTEQLEDYVKEENRLPFKVIDTTSEEVIGHAEIYKSEDNLAKLCRILIGEEKYRGKGIGEKIVNLLVKYSFEKLNVEKVELNVYDWNKQAIKCYEKSGFAINPDKKNKIIVQENIWISLNMTVNKTNWKIN